MKNFNIVFGLVARSRILKFPKDEGVSCAIAISYTFGVKQ
jgi:hypothetical protein